MAPIQGLHTGLVMQVAEDPAGDYRVRVSLPSLGTEAVWARVAGFYASNGFGAMFYPEVGDEVVVGFVDGDPRSPIVLGSLYSAKRPPASAPDPDNDKKAIVTRSRLAITYDDRDRVIEIMTPGGHSIRLDDSTGEIRIADRNGNSLTLGKSGIAIDSAFAIEMKAKTDISIKAGRNLDTEAGGKSVGPGRADKREDR